MTFKDNDHICKKIGFSNTTVEQDMQQIYLEFKYGMIKIII
jgi:hypothetical protein